MSKPLVFWLTGLSGAGKTTVATGALKLLEKAGKKLVLLDGDILRDGLNNDLGFSLEDRAENIRRAAEIARICNKNGISVICTFISPTQSIRKVASEIIGADQFFEIFIDTPIEICEKRDVKGLYEKARAGEIKLFSGIDSAYDQPMHPKYVLDCVANSVDESAQLLFEFITKQLN